MKDLPKVSAFAIDKKINNYQESFYGKNEERHEKKGNVINKINDIFASNDHIIKSRVRITLKDDIVERTIIGKSFRIDSFPFSRIEKITRINETELLIGGIRNPSNHFRFNTLICFSDRFHFDLAL